MPPTVLEADTRIDPATIPLAPLNALVGLEEAAAFLQVSHEEMRELIKLHLVPSLPSGHAYLIRFGDLVEYHGKREFRREHSRKSPLSRMFNTLYDEGCYGASSEFSAMAAS